MINSEFPADKKTEDRSRVNRDADNLQFLQLEEKDVGSSVVTVFLIFVVLESGYLWRNFMQSLMLFLNVATVFAQDLEGEAAAC